MRIIRRNMLTGLRCLHHDVILLILSLNLTDLALSQVRFDEFNCASDACAPGPSTGCRERNAPGAAPTDQREQQLETRESESWCSCCCVHILHSSVQTADIAIVKRPPAVLSIHFLPTSPPKDHFHPPRST